MSKKMYRLETEFDMGVADYVFKSREDAWRKMKEVHDYGQKCGWFACEDEDSFNCYVEEGLYSVETLELIEFDDE